MKRIDKKLDRQAKQLHDIMFPKQKLHTIDEFIRKYPPELKQRIATLLLSGKRVKFYDGGEGCYDAEFQGFPENYRTEITLDQSGKVEDIYCSCQEACCDHIYTLIWLIDKEQKSN